MTDETMLPRKLPRLSDRTFSVPAETKHTNNSTKLAERLTERKEAVPAWDCVASYIYDTNGKLVVRYSEYSESSLDWMGMDQLLVYTC